MAFVGHEFGSKCVQCFSFIAGVDPVVNDVVAFNPAQLLQCSKKGLSTTSSFAGVLGDSTPTRRTLSDAVCASSSPA